MKPCRDIFEIAEEIEYLGDSVNDTNTLLKKIYLIDTYMER